MRFSRWGLWGAGLLGVGAAAGAFLFFVNGVLVDDRNRPFPSADNEAVPVYETGLDLDADAVYLPPTGGNPDWEALCGEHPEADLRFLPERPGRARVTLAEGGGWTRRTALFSAERGVWEWAGVLPARATLSFHTGLLSRGPGFQFTIDLVDARGEIHRIHDERVSPLRHLAARRIGPWLPRRLRDFVSRKSHQDERWRFSRASLAAWGGQRVRLRFGVAPGEGFPPGSAMALWGAPGVWAPDETRAARRPPPSLVLAALDRARGDGVNLEGFSEDVPPRLRGLLREGVAYQRFYTTAAPPERALADLMTGRRAFPETPAPGPAWPAHLRSQGWRLAAIGAFDERTLALLEDAGFDEIRRLPHDGYDPLSVAADGLAWERARRGRGPNFLFLSFRNPPARRWAPARFLALSLRRLPWSPRRWAFWREAAATAYVDEYAGRLADGLKGPGAPLLAVVSLGGTSAGIYPVRWPSSGRRGWAFWNEPGWALREGEVRAVFVLRHPSLKGPRRIMAPADLWNVGPTLVRWAGAAPWTAGRGRALEPERDARGVDPNARVVIEGSHATALLVGGHLKYVRHDPGPGRKIRGVWPFSRPKQLDFDAEEVFDLWTDPEERRNLSHARRTLLARLRQVMDEAAPRAVEVRIGFLNPGGALVRGAVSCTAGRIAEAGATFPLLHRGPYDISFAVRDATGAVGFRPDPPDAAYSLSFKVDGRSLPVDRWRVSRLGLPLFESAGDEWHDRTKFDWMDGWVPPSPLNGEAVVSLGRFAPDGSHPALPPALAPPVLRRPTPVVAVSTAPAAPPLSRPPSEISPGAVSPVPLPDTFPAPPAGPKGVPPAPDPGGAP
jgi:arylsulfatase A-like enzyme